MSALEIGNKNRNCSMFLSVSGVGTGILAMEFLKYLKVFEVSREFCG